MKSRIFTTTGFSAGDAAVAESFGDFSRGTTIRLPGPPAPWPQVTCSSATIFASPAAWLSSLACSEIIVLLLPALPRSLRRCRRRPGHRELELVAVRVPQVDLRAARAARDGAVERIAARLQPVECAGGVLHLEGNMWELGHLRQVLARCVIAGTQRQEDR